MPVSVLKALSIVDFAVDAALVVTDVDTLFMDATLVVLDDARAPPVTRGLLPAFCDDLAAAAGLLMAHIVTNFGTLFRLRLMAVAPSRCCWH